MHDSLPRLILGLVLATLASGCKKAADPPQIGAPVAPLASSNKVTVTSERTHTGAPQITNVDLGIPAGVAGKNDRLQIYTPWVSPPGGSPCIFTSPSGESHFSGTSLGDRIPRWNQFAQAGFVVVVYETDGELKGDRQSDAAAAFRDFEMSQAGLVNAQHAIDYALSKYSSKIDPERLYAAGHGIAGGRALFLAAHDPRIKGCVTFAAVPGPTPDKLDFIVNEMTDVPERFRESIESFSAERYADQIKCPVSMFHGTADKVVGSDQTEAFVAKLANGNLESFDGVDHNGIIDRAMPQAIVWLRELAGVESELKADGNLSAKTVINRALILERTKRTKSEFESLSPAVRPIALKLLSPSGLYTQKEAFAVIEPLDELAKVPVVESDRDRVVELIFAWIGTNGKVAEPGLRAMQTWCTKDHAKRIQERLSARVYEDRVCETLIALDARDEVLMMINYPSAGPIAFSEAKRWGITDEQIAQQCREDRKSTNISIRKAAQERLESMGLASDE